MAFHFRTKGKKMKILVAGANGFVGRALIHKLTQNGHDVVALIRDINNKFEIENVSWITGDLLKSSTLNPLEKIEKAFYLVHGMKGEDRDFEYQESLAAVNFINWVKPSNPDIIYLGGLGPDSKSLSPHLRSRHLTGAILGSSGLNVLEFRASIIMGEGSLSFEMIKAMCERFPLRPELSLLNQKCQPLALSDLLKYLTSSLEFKKTGHSVIEIGGPEAVNYGELLDLYSEIAGLRRPKLKIPEVESKIILRALDYAVPEHAQIGKKLTESLEHPTVVTKDLAQKEFPTIMPINLRASMEMAINQSTSYYAPIWEKDFLKDLVTDKMLTQSGLISSELLRNLEKVAKLRKILSRK
jgi:uncharacterized protein YbjT (DUF2867 family)